MMKTLASLILFFVYHNSFAQKLVYDVELFGKKIGQTIVERIEKANGDIEYILSNHSQVDILFTHKTSEMKFDIVYREGKLISAYAKNVKDGITEICTTVWKETKYLIQRGEEKLQLTTPITYSGILLYFLEPDGKAKVYSERMGDFTTFKKTGTGEYECKTPNGVNNIYRYKNGKLVELEMSKGASVFMKLVQ